MEHSIHRQLKSLYVTDPQQHEVRVDGYRIDAVDGKRLIEIQYGSLGAIRNKIRRLVKSHDVLVVKPLAVRKQLLKRDVPDGPVVSKRLSPKKQTLWSLFDDLVHFVDVFPHPRLELEVLLTLQEEYRLPAERKRRVCRGYIVEDRLLAEVTGREMLRTVDDLVAMLPESIRPPARSEPFTTADLATAAGINRGLARKVAYCLRRCGAAEVVGKQGNAMLYELATAA
ncbi:MAG: hypothetical protein CMJ65_10935 [Planctomycetaceae bacterium]|nr:hypothetical protein [Planctomycetaceae bacterium]